jgi:hypothetical protein
MAQFESFNIPGGGGFPTGSSLTSGPGNSSAFYITLNFKR